VHPKSRAAARKHCIFKPKRKQIVLQFGAIGATFQSDAKAEVSRLTK
jgi:hypothetical protein